MQFVYGWVFWVSIVLGVLVAGALLYAMFKFRRRDEEDPPQFHGNTKLELTWTAIPFLIFVSLFGITLANMGFIDTAPEGAMQVHVVGKQFSWTFEYAGKHGRTSGKDVKSLTTLKIPADTPVALDLTSPDVNHSFYVPSLAGQVNAIPGQTNHMWLEAREGHYYGQCTELCGNNHAGMLLEVDSMPKAKFQEWLYSQEAK